MTGELQRKVKTLIYHTNDLNKLWKKNTAYIFIIYVYILYIPFIFRDFTLLIQPVDYTKCHCDSDEHQQRNQHLLFTTLN